MITTRSIMIFLLTFGGWTHAAAMAQDDAEKMQQMMEAAKKFTEPSEKHKLLEKFIGTWKLETRFVMQGKKSPPQPGKSTCGWLIKGRWIKSEGEGVMMGKPLKGFHILGYDNFKQSYVGTSVQNLDTAMLRYEGDVDPKSKALVMYGKLDEYLTGEHDKMVKYVWRFKSPDHYVFEVHDLSIGEKNTMVIEQTFTRSESQKAK